MAEPSGSKKGQPTNDAHMDVSCAVHDWAGVAMTENGAEPRAGGRAPRAPPFEVPIRHGQFSWARGSSRFRIRDAGGQRQHRNSASRHWENAMARW